MKRLQLVDTAKCAKVTAELEALHLTAAQIERVRDVFVAEIETALHGRPSSLQMENTFIPVHLLDGTEDGIYLAMDLGGTNLRLLFLRLSQGTIAKELVHHYPLPDELRIGCGTRLFDYLASCLDKFAVEHHLEDNKSYPLGFTFSFPMRHQCLDAGVLITWTKSFNCPSAVGEDIAELLRASLERCGRSNIKVVAILNDTAGTLMHGVWLNRRTRIGVVLGTGTNGCYMEPVARLKSYSRREANQTHDVAIDVEWGSFGDNGVLDFIRTDYDRQLDANSLLQRSFTYEKYIGGKFLGELCRLALYRLHAAQLFLPTLPASQFPKDYAFDTSLVALIEEDVQHATVETERILQQKFQCIYFDSNNSSSSSKGSCYSNDDIKILQHVCAAVTHRAAQLLAINISVLLNRMDPAGDSGGIVVAIDGSVYRHHKRLREWLHTYTMQWASKVKCEFILADDGSGKGAALVAAIALKQSTLPTM